MTANSIRARLAFSFKGENVVLEAVIDLDQCQTDADAPPNFHQWLASAGHVDPYSYQYEVLESEDIEFDQPTGLAASCCAAGRFDWATFAALRQEAHDRALALGAVRAVARQTLGIDTLDADSKLQAALLAAYRAGQLSVPSRKG